MIDPVPEQIEAAAKALYELEPWRAPSDRYHHTGSSVYLWDELSEEDQKNYRATARAALVAAAGVTPQEPGVRAAREFLEATLAESDADEKDPDGGSGWDVEVDARTVLDLLGEDAPPQVDEAKLARVIDQAILHWAESLGLANDERWALRDRCSRAVAEWLRGGGL